MFNSHVLETAIGMSLLFLGISLVITAIQEFATTLVGLRSRTLLSQLKSMMVQGENGLAFYNSVIAHPVVTPAGANPSYISSQQFSTAALQLMNLTAQLPAAAPPAVAAAQAVGTQLQQAVNNLDNASPFKKVATSLIRQGGTDLTDFETRLQNWFDQSMDRVSGIYKRWSQLISFILGGLLAFVFQVDAIRIASGLWSGCCGTIAAAGAKTVANENDALQALSQFDLHPIWQYWSHIHWTPLGPVFSFFVGCAVTTIAVSLGAPFWFDALQSFVSLRGTGPQPASTSATNASDSSPTKS
jgi:hypothetical protein